MRNVTRTVSAVGTRKDGYALTRAEKKVLHLIAKGLKRKEIALRLNVSVHTVKTHIERAYRKLEVHSGTAAVEKVVREQILAYSREESTSDSSE